jgi:hypothetical protein
LIELLSRGDAQRLAVELKRFFATANSVTASPTLALLIH